MIQAINAAAEPDDYILSAAGGLPGELTMGWRSKRSGRSTPSTATRRWATRSPVPGARASPDRSGEVIAWVGDGSYLMMNSDIYATVMTGQKVIFMVCDNGGFAVINRLQVNTGGAEFNNLLADEPRTLVQVDFVEHAESMGAIAERVDGIDELGAAFARAKAADRTLRHRHPGRPDTWTEGGAWWEVGVPEVIERPAVRAAREDWAENKRRQRVGV